MLATTISRCFLLGLAFAAMGGSVRAGDSSALTVNIEAAPGLKFDPPRFAVPPGAAVTVRYSQSR